MKKEGKLTVDCLDYVQIDVDTAMLTVLETRETPGLWPWSRPIRKESTEIYILMIPQRTWVYKQTALIPGSELGVKLWGIAVAKLAEARLDRFNATL